MYVELHLLAAGDDDWMCILNLLFILCQPTPATFFFFNFFFLRLSLHTSYDQTRWANLI